MKKAPVRSEAHHDAEPPSLSTRVKAEVGLDVLAGQAGGKHTVSPNLLSTGKAHFLQQAHTRYQPESQSQDQHTIFGMNGRSSHSHNGVVQFPGRTTHENCK